MKIAVLKSFTRTVRDYVRAECMQKMKRLFCRGRRVFHEQVSYGNRCQECWDKLWQNASKNVLSAIVKDVFPLIPLIWWTLSRCWQLIWMVSKLGKFLEKMIFSHACLFYFTTYSLNIYSVWWKLFLRLTF